MSNIPDLQNVPELSFIDNLTLAQVREQIIQDYATKYRELREMVEASSRIVAFTGAGCSTESGIADFRSSPGELANLGTNAPMSTEIGAIVPVF